MAEIEQPDEGWNAQDHVNDLSTLDETVLRASMLLLDKMRPELGIRKAIDGEKNARDLEYHSERRRREAKARLDAEEEARNGLKPLAVVPLGTIAEQIDLGLIDRPTPTVGGLLYERRVNTVYGDPTAGKTWLSLDQARAVAADGGKTLFLDYEDTEIGLASRCLAMDPKLASSILYLSVQGASMSAVVHEAKRLVATEDVRLVVIDSTGMSMAALGLNPYVDDDTARWFALLPYPLAQLGPAVLLLDHVPKSNDGTPTPVGSFRKTAAITGAQFWLESKQGFSRERSGWSRLVCTKDRCGTFATGEVVGRITFEPGEVGADKLGIAVELGPDGALRNLLAPKEQAIVDYVGECMLVHDTTDENGETIQGRPNFTTIRTKVGGRAESVRKTVDSLVQRGWLNEVTLASGKRSLVVYEPGTPFTEDSSESDDL